MITGAHPYLHFNGNCQQALDFYTQVFGGKTTFVQSFAEAGMTDLPKDSEHLIMNSYFVADKLDFMASDVLPNQPLNIGNNNALAMSIDTFEAGQRIFNALAERGQVTMPFQKTFWALGFGGIIDQFGIMWYVNVDDPEYKH